MECPLQSLIAAVMAPASIPGPKRRPFVHARGAIIVFAHRNTRPGHPGRVDQSFAALQHEVLVGSDQDRALRNCDVTMTVMQLWHRLVSNE
jgi:hypothetical protein